MRVVVAYDITDDGDRGRVAAALSVHGVRIQRSVFECDVDEGGLNDLLERLTGIIDASSDGIELIRQCADCLSGRIRVGVGDAIMDQDWWIV